MLASMDKWKKNHKYKNDAQTKPSIENNHFLETEFCHRGI